MERTPIEIKKHTPERVSDCQKCFSKHGPMLERLDDYDWREAFDYATYDREQVAEVLYADDGDNDGPAWIGLFKMCDGKFMGLNAWCDYTGWD